ncbi:uncharacterized protein CPUR_07214 [Claviceps purpurea 20.1]|uniref:Uncharacterized protein n=1 Tax=Claviceps purpurea (strain 20.1) TaxID=1111077 RepID=M1WAX5_CLAP2|nr:uncharacterized protein CPUR_07214 [Claviceps purpurea 20.1]
MDPTPMQGREIHKRSLPITPNSPSMRKKTKQTPASVPARCSSRSRPSLQDLPVELLESIFLYSMNLALPRSSPLLGAKLSAKITVSRVFMAAFHDIWELSLGACKGWSRPEWKRWSEPDDEELEEEGYFKLEKEASMKLEEDASIQFALLSMPWADIDFILNVQQAWADKYARGRVFDHGDGGGSTYSLGWDISYAPESYHQHILQHSLGELTFDARACFEADYDRALARPFPPGRFSGITQIIELNPPVAPVDLITGPWDEEQKRRLFWSARAKWDEYSERLYLGPHPVELKLACLDAAVISAKNLDPLIVNCLMNGWLFRDLPRGARHERLLKLVERIDRGGEVLDMDILRFVVKHLDYEFRFIEYHFPRRATGR